MNPKNKGNSNFDSKNEDKNRNVEVAIGRTAQKFKLRLFETLTKFYYLIAFLLQEIPSQGKFPR